MLSKVTLPSSDPRAESCDFPKHIGLFSGKGLLFRKNVYLCTVWRLYSMCAYDTFHDICMLRRYKYCVQRKYWNVGTVGITTTFFAYMQHAVGWPYKDRVHDKIISVSTKFYAYGSSLAYCLSFPSCSFKGSVSRKLRPRLLYIVGKISI